MTWFVVHSKARQEELAARNLERQGFGVYYPRLQRRKRGKSGWTWQTGPLFPRYLFVDVTLGEQSTAVIRSTIGVATLVRFGPELVSIPDLVIEQLRAGEQASCAARVDEAWPHRPGDRVAIAEGPFAGLSGVFQVAKDAERVVMLLECLGRQNEVVVRREALGDVLAPAASPPVLSGGSRG